MYCRCGALIADGLASFCGRCGKRLDPSAAVHPGEHDFEAQCAATLRAAGVLDILELMANATKRAKPPR
jgi:hypothetical protein